MSLTLVHCIVTSMYNVGEVSRLIKVFLLIVVDFFICYKRLFWIHRKSSYWAVWLRPRSNWPPLNLFLLWQTHDSILIHQTMLCSTDRKQTMTLSCPLSATFLDWTVVYAGCQASYPQLHHSEWTQLPGVSQKNLAGELFNPCCPLLPRVISS